MRRRSFYWVVIAVVVVACLVMAFAWQTRQRNEAFRHTAQADLQKARRELSPAATADDAKRWLESNGFHLKRIGDNWVGERSGPGLATAPVVIGYKLLAPASALRAERWMELTVWFKATDEPFVPGAFVGVEADDDSPPSKVSRSQFSIAPASSPAR